MNLSRLQFAFILTVVSFAFFFYAVYVFADAKTESSPALDATTRATSRYLPVMFDSHEQHAKDDGIACARCHHDIEKEGQKPASCKSCHDKPGSEVDLKTAMHTSCLECHKSIAAKTPSTKAPVQCLSCHRERK